MTTLGEVQGLVTDAELERMPCECPKSKSRRCGAGWIRCRRKMFAWVRACNARLRIARRVEGT